MKDTPIILHIELGDQSLSQWLKSNSYIIYSELIRYSEKLIKENLDVVQAIMISNHYDNIVFLLKRENINLTLNKAMDFFMNIEEYEKCAEIRNLNILIENQKNETKNIKVSKSNQRGLKNNR
jgi:hypothetical protein